MEPISTTRIDGFYSYLESLDWSEPWLYCLAGFHLSLLSLAWATRKAGAVQATLFFTLLGVVFFSEHLNEHLAKDHKWFTKHQYFDSSGLFISVVLSLPLLLICCFIVCVWFVESAALMKDLRAKKLGQSSTARTPNGEEKDDNKEEVVSSSEVARTRRRRTRRED